MELPYAETINYWKSNRQSPDAILDKVESLIEKFGGEVVLRAKGKSGDYKAYAIEFIFSSNKYRIAYPVLPTKGTQTKDAERQACNLIFHKVKSCVLDAKIFGFHKAFFNYWLIDGNQPISSIDYNDLKLLNQPDYEVHN